MTEINDLIKVTLALTIWTGIAVGVARICLMTRRQERS